MAGATTTTGPAAPAGFGLNLNGGKVTVLALTHIGPENSKHVTPQANSALRYLNDVVVAWKATDKLTFTGEPNYIKEDLNGAEAYGAAGYVELRVDRQPHAEWARGSVSRQQQLLRLHAGRRTRFRRHRARDVRPRDHRFEGDDIFGVHGGLHLQAPWLSERIATAVIRPEIRYDRALNDSRPFGNGHSVGALMFASDLIIGF